MMRMAEFLPGYTRKYMRRQANAIFILCMLKANVSIREPQTGKQALHILFSNHWSAEFSPYFMHIAYTLILYGGADVHAVDYYNFSSTAYAIQYGWWNEWLIVLDHCGIDPHEVCRKQIDSWDRSRFLGDGESTAVDSEDLSISNFDNLTRRRRVVGDRLDE